MATKFQDVLIFLPKPLFKFCKYAFVATLAVFTLASVTLIPLSSEGFLPNSSLVIIFYTLGALGIELSLFAMAILYEHICRHAQGKPAILTHKRGYDISAITG